MIVDYHVQREMIFEHSTWIFTKILNLYFSLIFLFRNVLISLASAKNLVYNIEFIARITKAWLCRVLWTDSTSFFTPSYPDVVPWLRFKGLLFLLSSVFQGRCWWNTLYYSWNWINESDCSSIWTCSSEWKWYPLSTAMENVFELYGKKKSISFVLFWNSHKHGWNTA